MNLLFNSTEDFENDLRNFDETARQRIAERVNEVAQSFAQDKQRFARQARKPYRVPLGNGYASSLYAVKVAPDARIVMAVDNDPLFDQVIVTLIRVVSRAALQEAYQAAAQALYQPLNGHCTKPGAKVGCNQSVAG